MPKGYSNVNKYTPFRLTLKKEAILTVTGVSFQQIGNCILSGMTVTDPTKLKKSNVNSFDRFACKYYSKKLSYLSDNTKDATTILLALSLLSHLKTINGENLQALLSDLVLFLEAETIIVGMTKCAKGLSERPRPYVYNSELPLGKRQRRVSFESFWSGHASLAFTTAVFTGYVFQNRHPGSRLIVPVWITGIGCATATGVLRVLSGNHFPTDVIMSAAVGSFVGWLVPSVHQEKNYSVSLTTNVAGTTGLGLLYHF